MTDDELKAIEARANAAIEAVPVPWYQNSGLPYIVKAKTDPDAPRGYTKESEVAECQDERIAAFVAHARADVPALIAAVRERDDTIDGLRAAVEFCGKSSDREVQLFGVWLRPSRRGDASGVANHRDAIAERDAEIARLREEHKRDLAAFREAVDRHDNERAQFAEECARLRALLSPAAIVSRPACATCLRAWDVCVCERTS